MAHVMDVFAFCPSLTSGGLSQLRVGNLHEKTAQVLQIWHSSMGTFLKVQFT